MVTRTTKYTASDGTEHDSPQAAATHDLQNSLYRLIEQALPEISTDDLVKLTMNLSVHLPEALRDALDTYFEDLEAHPDVDDPASIFHDVPLPPGWCGEFDTTRGFEFDLATGSSQSFEIKADGTFTTDAEGMFYATEQDLEREGKAVGEMLRKSNPRVVYKPAPLGNPDDPTTWAVDHPQYCRPFGTRED